MKFRRRTVAPVEVDPLPRIDVPPWTFPPPLTLKGIVDVDQDITIYAGDLGAASSNTSWTKALRAHPQLPIDMASLEAVQKPWLQAKEPLEDLLDSIVQQSAGINHFDWALLPTIPDTNLFSAQLVMTYVHGTTAAHSPQMGAFEPLSPLHVRRPLSSPGETVPTQKKLK